MFAGDVGVAGEAGPAVSPGGAAAPGEECAGVVDGDADERGGGAGGGALAEEVRGVGAG